MSAPRPPTAPPPCTHDRTWLRADGKCQGCEEDREHAEWLMKATPERIIEIYFSCCDCKKGRGSWVCKDCLDKATRAAFEAGLAQGRAACG